MNLIEGESLTAADPNAPRSQRPLNDATSMVIVAGHIKVDPEQRESYLAGSMSVVERARRADGCLDFAITADLLDPGRVNLF